MSMVFMPRWMKWFLTLDLLGILVLGGIMFVYDVPVPCPLVTGAPNTEFCTIGFRQVFFQSITTMADQMRAWKMPESSTQPTGRIDIGPILVPILFGFMVFVIVYPFARQLSQTKAELRRLRKEKGLEEVASS